MPEAIDTSATITASEAFLHSGIGPQSDDKQVSSNANVSAGTAEGGGGGSPTLPTTGWQWPLGM